MAAESTYTPIETITNSSYANVTFSNIPQTYTDLFISCYTNTQQAGSPIDTLIMYFNAGGSGVYSTTVLVGNGSTVTSTRFSSENYIRTGQRPAFATNLYGNIDININNYSNTSTFKTILTSNSADQNGSGTTQLHVASYRSTSAITSISLAGVNNYPGPGSVFTLYGIKEA
jgi:hypothetical protein